MDYIQSQSSDQNTARSSSLNLGGTQTQDKTATQQFIDIIHKAKQNKRVLYGDKDKDQFDLENKKYTNQAKVSFTPFNEIQPDQPEDEEGMNERLRQERINKNPLFRKLKASFTDMVFQNRLYDVWQSEVYDQDGKTGGQVQPQQDQEGQQDVTQLGKVAVPFFPEQWQDTSNDIFNKSGGHTCYGVQKSPRATSGKHFSREHHYSQTQSDFYQDAPDVSQVKKYHDSTQFITNNMNKLFRIMRKKNTNEDDLNEAIENYKREHPHLFQEMRKQFDCEDDQHNYRKMLEQQDYSQQSYKESEQRRRKNRHYLVPVGQQDRQSQITSQQRSSTVQSFRSSALQSSQKTDERPKEIEIESLKLDLTKRRLNEIPLRDVKIPKKRKEAGLIDWDSYQPYHYQHSSGSKLKPLSQNLHNQTNRQLMRKTARAVQSNLPGISQSVDAKTHRAFLINNLQRQSVDRLQKVTTIEQNDRTSDQKSQRTIKPQKMELVQQFVLVRNKLQPALKYITPQTKLINKYKVNGQAQIEDDQVLLEDQQEVITVPAKQAADVRDSRQHYADEVAGKRAWTTQATYESQDLNQYAQYKRVVKERKVHRKLLLAQQSLQQESAVEDADTSDIQHELTVEECELIQDPRTCDQLYLENRGLYESLQQQVSTLEAYMQLAKELSVKFAIEPQQQQVVPALEPASASKEDVVPRIGKRVVEQAGTVRAIVVGDLSTSLERSSKVQQSQKKQKSEVIMAENQKRKNDNQKKLEIEIEKVALQIYEIERQFPQLVPQEQRVQSLKSNLHQLLQQNTQSLTKASDSQGQLAFIESKLQLVSKNSYLIQQLVMLQTGALKRKVWLDHWFRHSELFCLQKKEKLCSQIVNLCQLKNLFAMYNGKPYIQVGVVEGNMGFDLTERQIQDLIELGGSEIGKLMRETSRGWIIVSIIERETATFGIIDSEMREFISRIFGNEMWDRMTMSRMLKEKQLKQNDQYDPDHEDIPAVYELQRQKAIKPSKEQVKSPTEQPQPETNRKSLFARLLNNVNEDTQKAPVESKYALIFNQERLERERRESEAKQERISKFQKLADETDSDASDGGKKMYQQMAGRHLFSYLDKVSNHLEAETKVIDAWKHQDWIKECEKKAKGHDFPGMF